MCQCCTKCCADLAVRITVSMGLETGFEVVATLRGVTAMEDSELSSYSSGRTGLGAEFERDNGLHSRWNRSGCRFLG